jgi:hypothetical protein
VGQVTCMGRGEVFTGFWLRGSKVGDHCEGLRVGRRRWGSMGQTGFGWLRIGSSGRLLWT